MADQLGTTMDSPSVLSFAAERNTLRELHELDRQQLDEARFRDLRLGETLEELSREIPQLRVEKELHHFPPPKTPAEVLYARVAQLIAHPEGVGLEEGRDEDFRTGGSPRLFRTHRLTEVGRSAASHIRLPLSVMDRTESLMAEAATSHIVNSMRRTLRSPHLQFSPIYSKKWSKRELTIPVSPTNIPMSGMDTHVFFTTVMPKLYAQCLSLLTELRKRLGGNWVLSRDGGKQCVKNELDVGCRGARVLAWQSIVQAEEERRKYELSERTGKPPPGPGRKELPATHERSGLQAVVVEALGRYSVYSASAGYLFREPTLHPGHTDGTG
ncbi:hypothetical protein HOY80DRAFT_1006550 [Tuber brumale]|nr:hypothetical protein HOY80DRAFT_1006550 [Tuber brumale]